MAGSGGGMHPEGLEALLAERDIRRLALDYADAFLVRDEGLLVGLFADGARTAAPGELDLAWAHGVVRRWDAFGLTMLHVTNHLVWLRTPDEARGRVWCLAQMDRADGFVDQSIVYEDEYVKRRGTWLFAVRRHLLWFGERRVRHPLHQPPAAWPASQVGAGTLAGDAPALRRAGAASRRG